MQQLGKAEWLPDFRALLGIDDPFLKCLDDHVIEDTLRLDERISRFDGS